MGLYYIWFRLTRPFKQDKLDWGLEVQQRYTSLCLKLFGTKHSYEGKLYDGPALYISNHRSLLDPVIIRQYIKALGVAKGEIERYPIAGKAIKGTGVIFVHRSDKASRSEAKDAIVQMLQVGYSVLLFPEGTVSGETTTLPFKRGSFEKAVEANVPVIPLTLIYNDPKYHWFNISTVDYYFKSFGWNTPNAHLIIGKPITAASADELMNSSRGIINETLVSHI